MLTQARIRELLHYCPESGVFTNIKARKKVVVGSVAGYLNNHGYVVIMVDGKQYRAHRLAWLYIHGTFPPNQIDHINMVKTDNRICNLRMATHSENQQNRPIQCNNTSGHIGVSWHKRDQKWMAYIKRDGKSIFLGRFKYINEAIAARNAAKQKHHHFNGA